MKYLIEVENNLEEKYHTSYAISLIENLNVLIPKKTENNNFNLIKLEYGDEPGNF